MHLSDYADAHFLPGVLVNDDPVPQRHPKAHINAIHAVVATMEGTEEGYHLDLHVDVRLPKRRSRGPVAGGDTECEPVRSMWVKRVRFHFWEKCKTPPANTECKRPL